MGCGLGYFTNEIATIVGQQNVAGIDISETAIAKAQASFTNIRFQTKKFDDFDFILSLKPDVIVMAEITWYVLPELENFIKFYRNSLKDTQLIHLLTTYGANQKYGNQYFSDLKGILDYFSLNYVQFGEIFKPKDKVSRTYFWGTN
jgi:2-polyprenyl-3-methyl-5-hydroxy-6-metoxy-1,4-benzoquinol methylase